MALGKSRRVERRRRTRHDSHPAIRLPLRVFPDGFPEAVEMGSEDHDGRIPRQQGPRRPPGLSGHLVETRDLRTKGGTAFGEKIGVAEIDRRQKGEAGRQPRADTPHHRHGPEVAFRPLLVHHHDGRTTGVGQMATERMELRERQVLAPRLPRPPRVPG